MGATAHEPGRRANSLKAIVRQDLTLLIPTLGRPILERALSAIEDGTEWPAEVLVVDQSSDAAARPLAQAFSARGLQVRWLPCAGRGRSLGINTGLAAVVTDWVLITDDDCLADRYWVGAMRKRLLDMPGGLVTGRVDAMDGDIQLSVATGDAEVVQRRPSVRFDRLSGGNMGAHRDVLRQVGPFTTEESMRTAEDGDYAYRALRSGVPILYAPECRVVHLGWRDAASRQAQYAAYALSQGGFLGYHARRGALLIWLRTVVHLVRTLKRWLIGSVLGDRELSLNGKCYVMGFFPGFRAGWKAAGAKPDPLAS